MISVIIGLFYSLLHFHFELRCERALSLVWLGDWAASGPTGGPGDSVFL